MKVLLLALALITTHLAVMGFSVDEESYTDVPVNHTCQSDTDKCCKFEDYGKYSLSVPSYTKPSSDGPIQVKAGCSYNVPFAAIIECPAHYWILQVTCFGINIGGYNTTCDETVNEYGEQECPMVVGHTYGNTWLMDVPSGLPNIDVTCTFNFFAEGQYSMGSFDVDLRIGDYECPP